MDQRQLLKGNTSTLILAVLRDRPLHGYAIAREIERRSGSTLQFKEGTLYPALQGLERDGLITGEWEQGPGGRSRRVYSLTPAGTGALEEQNRAWEQFARAVDGVLKGGGDAPDVEPERAKPGSRLPKRAPQLG